MGSSPTPGIVRARPALVASRPPVAIGHAAAYTSVPTGALTLLASETLRWYVADERERGFCARCGASLFWRVSGSDAMSIAAGTVDPPTGLRISHHIYAADASDYEAHPAD